MDYLNKIAASDNALAENLASARRTDLCRIWLVDAMKPFRPVLQNPDTSTAELESLIESASEQVNALDNLRDALKTQRTAELESRQAARTALEKSLETERRPLLNTLAGLGT